MATYKGKEGVISADGSFIGEVRSFELTITSNEVDTSTMGSDWTGTNSTQLSWKGTCEAFWDFEDAGQVAIPVGQKVAIDFFPAGNSTGKRLESGSALVMSVNRSQSHDNIVTATFEFTGDGPLTVGAVA